MSYSTDCGTPPKKAKACTCPSTRACAVAAGEPVFRLEPLVDPFRRVALFEEHILIPLKPAVDDLRKTIKLRTLDLLRAPLSWRRRKRQHLANTVTRYVEMARQFPLPHTIAARKPKLPIKFHGVILLTLPAAAKREKVDNFYAARTANRAALTWPNFARPFSARKDQKWSPLGFQTVNHAPARKSIGPEPRIEWSVL